MAARTAKRTIASVEEPQRELEEREPRIGDAHPERICPNCGAPLLELRCKLLCPNRECGYYMSCSDFY